MNVLLAHVARQPSCKVVYLHVLATNSQAIGEGVHSVGGVVILMLLPQISTTGSVSGSSYGCLDTTRSETSQQMDSSIVAMPTEANLTWGTSLAS